MCLRGGFTFCGYDIADLNLEYAPDNENTYVYRPAKTNVHEETMDGHNGGYYYGAYKQPKEFILRCFYEEKDIDRGLMSKLFHIFKIGKSGELIFKRMPWYSYYVTVINVDDREMLNYRNGLITITMKAGYPFARGINMNEPYTNEHLFYSLPVDKYHDKVIQNTGLFTSAEMVPQMTFQDIQLTAPNKKTIFLANPGTERAAVGLSLAGNAGDGIIIANATTRQECHIVGMTRSATTGAQKTLYIDGISGKTVLRNSVSSEISFLYHSAGFIEIEPTSPVIRGLYVAEVGTNTISLVNNLNENVIGRYIFINSHWHKILNQTENNVLTLRVSDNEPLGPQDKSTMICDLNEVTISPVTDLYLDVLSFIYKPTYS